MSGELIQRMGELDREIRRLVADCDDTSATVVQEIGRGMANGWSEFNAAKVHATLEELRAKRNLLSEKRSEWERLSRQFNSGM